MSQATAITTALANISGSPASSFGKQTYQVRVSSTLPVWIRYGDGAQTAVAGDTLINANAPAEYFTVTPGQSIAFFSTSTSTGYVSITEMG